jgi:hypothetical protein
MNEMSKWQPIETAPKNGNRLLLCEAGWIDVGYWRVDLNGPDTGEGWTCERVQSWGYEEYAYCKPSHWMPLPEAPAQQ